MGLADRLIAAGVPAELVAEAARLEGKVETLEATLAAIAAGNPDRTARQERNRRYYEARRLKASEKRLNSDATPPVLIQTESVLKRLNSDEPSRADTQTTNSSESHKKKKVRGEKRLKPTPRAELLAVLDDVRATAVIEHRQRIGKPITAYGAKLLAGKFRLVPDPNAAADLMIEKGWRGFEPEYLQNLATGPPGRTPSPAAKTELPKWEGPFDGYRTAAERDKARNGEVLRRGHGVHRDDEEGDGEGSLFGDQTGHG